MLSLARRARHPTIQGGMPALKFVDLLLIAESGDYDQLLNA
jgi:hypothetical protein